MLGDPPGWPDTANGGQGNDFLAGGKGANVLKGDGWEEILVGNRDDAYFDWMDGGRGDDMLVAGHVKFENCTDEGEKGSSTLVGPRPDNPEWYSPNLTRGNFMQGGDGYDEFVLDRNSYVHITDLGPQEDAIIISGLGDHTLRESIKVVQHAEGYFGNHHFRIILDGNIVLAEINGYHAIGGVSNFDPEDPDDVQAAIGRIWSGIAAYRRNTGSED